MRRDLGRGLARGAAVAAAVLACVCSLAAPAGAATPAKATLTLGSNGKGKVAWKGTVSSNAISLGATTDACFDSNRKPDPASGCDFFVLTVNAPVPIIQRFIGSIDVTADGFGMQDLDLGVYVRNPNGTKGYQINSTDDPGAGGNMAGQAEKFPIENPTGPAGSYYVVLVPYSALPGTTYNGAATFNLKAANPSLSGLNKRLGPGPANYRASHDKYNSHSEPSIAMDPLNHNHLMAGSKMYERLGQYLFKAGTYESSNGGRTWKDWGQLPGYCTAPGQCDPNDEERYRTVSDISLAFDDEGNAYANMLDAPGGTLGFTGFNMTVNIKRPGKLWSGPVVVHDNQSNAITQQTLLDDKNWIAVDNVTDTSGGPNKPRDGKIGTMYVCWSLDVTVNPIPGQQIVLMRSTDGGKTWFGNVPNDNTPKQLSQKTAVSGIGCEEAIGPHGEVYVTWYDNNLGRLMQVKSTDRGQTFTPARPIAAITGVNSAFPSQQFRNLSIPTSAVDGNGNVYVAVASQDGDGSPIAAGRLVGSFKHPAVPDPRDEGAEGATTAKTGSGADIVLFKSTDGGLTYTGPVRVNQDVKTGDGDQFQPWLAVTPKGQVNVTYFDRRNDRNGLFIDTFLSRSNNGGTSWKDTRVTHQAWDPRLNPPTSTSGEFIGDYQGLVADDSFAIPFWNDTQAAQLGKGSKGYSPWQEVYAARIPNDAKHGGPGCRDLSPPKTSIPRDNVTVQNRRLSFHGSAIDVGCKGKIRDVRVSVGLLKGNGRCQFLEQNGSFSEARSCSKRVLLPAVITKKYASGKRAWRFGSSRQLPKGDYRVWASSRDVAGNVEQPIFRRNTVRFTVK